MLELETKLQIVVNMLKAKPRNVKQKRKRSKACQIMPKSTTANK